MTTDSIVRLETMTEEDCIRLLEAHHFGRVAIVVDGAPVVLPVNYVLDHDGAVVFCSGEGLKLQAALHGRDVGFEIDRHDPIYHRGWSVLVQGPATVVDDEGEQARLRSLPLRPWAPIEHAVWIRVRPRSISGRRLRSP